MFVELILPLICRARYERIRRRLDLVRKYSLQLVIHSEPLSLLGRCLLVSAIPSCNLHKIKSVKQSLCGEKAGI